MTTNCKLPARSCYSVTGGQTANFQKGFSLIETIVTISIVTVAFFAIIQIFPFSIQINKKAQNLTTASYLAQAGIERALSVGYDDLTTGAYETKDRLSEESNSFLYYFQRQTSVEYVDANLQAAGSDAGLKKVEVTVFWDEPMIIGEKSYVLTTLVSKK